MPMRTVAPLVGRQRELAVVRAAATAAVHGAGGALLVHGVAGGGKTAIVHAGLHGSGLRLVTAPPFRHGSPTLWPLARALGLTSPAATTADLLAAATALAGAGPAAVLV